MKNIRNIELARMHKEVHEINSILKAHNITQEILNAIDRLDTLETRLHNLAYGDCQFPLHLVKSRVKRGRLQVFPKIVETFEDVA